MPIPDFTPKGLLPDGIYDCTLDEIGGRLTWSDRRRMLFRNFEAWLSQEIRPAYSEPIYVDGSFVTDKEHPDDIDVVLDLTGSDRDRQKEGLFLFAANRARFMNDFNVHFWVDLPNENCFCSFFQYVGSKTAQFKGIGPKTLKGILRLR